MSLPTVLAINGGQGVDLYDAVCTIHAHIASTVGNDMKDASCSNQKSMEKLSSLLHCKMKM
jgi:hypothetical protein